MGIEKIVHALCLGAALCSAQTIAINGTVRDQAGLTIAGATVTLENAALSTISGAAGEFMLSGVSTAIKPQTTTHPSAALPIQIHQGSISLTLTESAPVSIRVHDLKGRLLHVSTASYSVGTHTLPSLLASKGQCRWYNRGKLYCQIAGHTDRLASHVTILPLSTSLSSLFPWQ